MWKVRTSVAFSEKLLVIRLWTYACLMHCLPSLFFTITIYQIDLWNIPDYSNIKSCCKLKPKSTFCFYIFKKLPLCQKGLQGISKKFTNCESTNTIFTLTGKGQVSLFTVCSQVEHWEQLTHPHVAQTTPTKTAVTVCNFSTWSFFQSEKN